MKNCSDFLSIYTTFQALVKTQHYATIKYFKCDLGGEYTTSSFNELLTLDGTIHQSSCIDTLEQNEVVDRKHRYIIETAHSLLLYGSIFTFF